MTKIPDLKEFFGLDTDPIAGLEIGSTGVKVMLLNRDADGQEVVQNFAIEPLEPGVVHEKTIVNRDRVIEAMKAAAIKAQLPTKKICMAIPNSMVITKVIKVGADLTDKDIGYEIEMDSNKYIPYPLSEVNLDYEVVGPVDGSDTLVNVLVVASKKENVANIADLLSAAGFHAGIVDVDAYAIARAFEPVAKKLPNQGKNKVVAILDIGATMTTFNVVDHGIVVYAREQAFGSQQLVDEIQNVYGLTYQETILAMQYENLPKDFYPELLEPFKQAIVQQTSRFCQFFFSAGDYNAVDYIFLTGGCANFFGLDTAVQNKLQIKTFVARPMSDLKFAGNISQEEFNASRLRLMKCYGLAQRNIV